MGMGVGIGETDDTAGRTSCGAVCPFSFPVVPFFVFRRGGGELRGYAIESPSLLKKSPIGLPATAECPPARNAVIDKIKTTLLSRQSIIAATLHYTVQCSISPALFVVGTPREACDHADPVGT
jgi:hypothetical protein